MRFKPTSGGADLGLMRLRDIALLSLVAVMLPTGMPGDGRTIVAKRGTFVIEDIGPYEPGPLRIVGMLRGAGAVVEILDEAGAPLPRRNDRSEALDSSVFVQFEVMPAPGPGERLRLTAGAGEDAELDAEFIRDGQPSLLVTVGRYRYETGTPIAIHAILRDAAMLPVLDFSGKATATLHGAKTQEIDLVDAGNGTFSGTFAPVSMPGELVAVASIDGTSSSLGRLTRRRATGLVVRGRHATIDSFLGARTSDGDGNGLADDLLVSFKVSVSVPGEYVLQGVFESAAGATEQCSAFVHVPAVPTSLVMTLDVPAEAIQKTGGGHCTLRDITLIDAEGRTSFHEFPTTSVGSIEPASFEPLPVSGDAYGDVFDD